jgi:hypothetical protein
MTTFVAPTSKFSRVVPFGFDPLTLSNRVASFISGRGYQIATGCAGWIDPSKGNTVVQVTGANQPAFGATTGPNNKAALTFDGTNDGLKLLFSLPKPVHAFIMAKFTSSGTTGTLLDGPGPNNAMRLFRTGTARMSIYNLGAQLDSTTLPDLTQWHLHEAFFNGATTYYKVDGAAPAISGDAGANPDAGGICFATLGDGATDPFGGSIAEAHFFSAEKTGAELANLKRYFAAKFAVTISS